ncbi:MAG: TfoX/Sxy family protein [Burkholderiaceae bacterium]|nr:TfoX/Sxy family protein [Burkholderiaceae bacterium]
MAVDPSLVAHCLELLSVLGPARSRRMFGGQGLYVGEHFVALIADDTLYLKADELARPAFEAAGCRPFSYNAAGGRRAVMAYWSAPDEAMESPAQMRPWARQALESALRAAAARRTAVPRKAAARARQTAATGDAPAGRSPGAASTRPRRAKA